MPIVSLSLTSDLLRRLDGALKEGGYSSRSEAIRDALRSYLSEYALSKFDRGRVAATVTVMSERDKRGVDERLTQLRHEHDDIVSGNMHIHLGESFCLEIFITEGEAREVLNFIGRVRAIRGVDQVKYSMVPLA